MKNKLEYKLFFYSFLAAVLIVLYLVLNESYQRHEKMQQHQEKVLKIESKAPVYYAGYDIPIKQGVAGAVIITLMAFSVIVIMVIVVVRRLGTRIPDDIYWTNAEGAIKFYSEHVSLNKVYGYDQKGNKYVAQVVTYPDNSYDEEDIMFIEKVK